MNTERWRQISQLYNAALARDLAVAGGAGVSENGRSVNWDTRLMRPIVYRCWPLSAAWSVLRSCMPRR
jgi:hypothetical protein